MRRTPRGSIPGEADNEGQSYRTELRCALAPEVGAMLEHARRCYSLEAGEAVSTAQVVEKALASYIAGREVSEKVLEKVRDQANRDLLAQQARRLPVVAEARELAVSMGLLNLEEEREEALDDSADTEAADFSMEAEGEECAMEAPESEAAAEEAFEAQCVVVSRSGEVAKGATLEAQSGEVEKGSKVAYSHFGQLLAEALGCTHQEHLARAAFDCCTIEEHSTKESGRGPMEGHPTEESDRGNIEEHRAGAPAGAFAITGPRAECPARVANGPDYSHTLPPDFDFEHSSHAFSLSAATAASLDTAAWRNSRLRFNRKSRVASKAQRQELLRRDGWCCRTPGCPHQVWLHLHHLHEYAKGGATTPDNLLALCAGCHRNLHDGLLQLTQDADGRLVFSDAQGRRLDRQLDLELATWLDFHLGWSGQEYDSHWIRANKDEWAVYQAVS